MIVNETVWFLDRIIKSLQSFIKIYDIFDRLVFIIINWSLLFEPKICWHLQSFFAICFFFFCLLFCLPPVIIVSKGSTLDCGQPIFDSKSLWAMVTVAWWLVSNSTFWPGRWCCGSDNHPSAEPSTRVLSLLLGERQSRNRSMTNHQSCDVVKSATIWLAIARISIWSLFRPIFYWLVRAEDKMPYIRFKWASHWSI